MSYTVKTYTKEFYGGLIGLLSPIFPEGVIIAGGCLRDLSYGYDPKDIDVFVNIDNELELELRLEDVCSVLEPVLGRQRERYNLFQDNAEDCEYNSFIRVNIDDDDEKIPSCVAVFELYFENIKAPLQFIAKPLKDEWNGNTVVSTFDYNLVQQWIDSEDGEVKGVEEVQKAIAERALYLKNSDKKTEERLKRFLARTSFEPSNKEDEALKFLKSPMYTLQKLGQEFDSKLTGKGILDSTVFTG